MTRARYETVIWVPGGNPEDATRAPAEFDEIAACLIACGAQPLEHMQHGADDRIPDPMLL